MWASHLRLALRNLVRDKTFSLVNIFGLSFGIAATLLVLAFVQHELSYDRGFAHADRTYRVATDVTMSGSELPAASSPIELAPSLLQDFPEVENAVRMQFPSEILLGVDERRFRFPRMMVADSTLFSVFDIPLEVGDPATALARPQSILLTREAADRLFPNDDAIGKLVKLNNDREYEVTGIVGDMPRPTHLPDVAAIASFESFPQPESVNRWFLIGYYTFVTLKPGASADDLQAKLPAFTTLHVGEHMETYGMHLAFKLEPLTSIWLHTSHIAEPKGSGDMGRVVTFSAIGLLIVLIASINFINLSTARSSRRAREVGVRKTLGARRDQLVRQFFGESLLLAGLALLLALGIAEAATSWFNRFLTDPIQLDLLHNPTLLLGLLGVFVFVVVIAGTVPALAYSAFQPAAVLKGQLRTGAGGQRLRRILVVVQFAISIALIIGTFTVFRQMEFMQKQSLGFVKDQVLILRIPSQSFARSMEEVKHRLKESPTIIAASASSSIPGKGYSKRIFLPEGYADNEVTEAGLLTVDNDFLATYGIEMAEGRFFDPERPADSTNFVLNQAEARKLGWDKPVGKKFDFPPRGEYGGEVIGVVRDFHMESLRSAIYPFVLHLSATPKRYLSVRFAPSDIESTLDHVRRVWQEFAPEWPFDYVFLDEDFDRAYTSDRQFGQLLGSFTLLAIVIACLGLYGLAAFVAEQRTREIGVRKVLGASSGSLFALMTRDLLWLVLLANLVAWPSAWFLMRRWLEGFAYRTPISIPVFLLASALALSIALLTIGGHALRAAHVNPVRALRTE